MSTHCKEFLEETQRQIDEEGLLGISGTNFERGDSIIRVLKAKQFEYKQYSGKHASLSAIALEMNAMNKAIAAGKGKPFKFNDSTRQKPSPEAKKIIGECLFKQCQ